jgi:hypothetical protein
MLESKRSQEAQQKFALARSHAEKGHRLKVSAQIKRLAADEENRLAEQELAVAKRLHQEGMLLLRDEAAAEIYELEILSRERIVLLQDRAHSRELAESALRTAGVLSNQAMMLRVLGCF